MRIVVTGGTGFLGAPLVEALVRAGHEVRLLLRRPRTGLDPRTQFWLWDAMAGEPPLEALEGADAVVNLAGEPVAQRWTSEVKRRIRASRVDGTRHLVAGLEKLRNRPRVLLSGSAIGYYGDRGDELLTEESPPGRGFLPEVCQEWEAAACRAREFGLRVVLLRTGIVLGRNGGALARMLPLFQWGAGGRLGDGRQWMSWIHLQDVIGLIQWALEQEQISGPVNVVAPHPVRNAEFTRALGRALRRPALFTVPRVILELLFGEMAQVLLESQRVKPAVAEREGFSFQFPVLDLALRDLLA